MSVGLYDADKATYPLIVYNLDLMKYATYYKQQNEIVSYTEQYNPENYSKFIFRKDYDDGVYPFELSRQKNVDYGGLAFSAPYYQPLPMDIELCVPDRTIYWRWFKNYIFSSAAEKTAYITMNNCEHLRLSLDNETVWKDYLKPTTLRGHTRVLIFHDPDLASIDGAREAIAAAVDACPNRNKIYVGNKFPITIYSNEEFQKWNTLTYSAYSSFSIPQLLSDADLRDIVQSLQSHAASRRIEYWITNDSFSENDFLDNYLFKILHQCVLLRNLKANFVLKYNEELFEDKHWVQYLALLSLFITSELREPSVIPQRESHATWMKGYATYWAYHHAESKTQAVRELFVWLSEHNYPFFKEMYEYNGYRWMEEHNNDW